MNELQRTQYLEEMGIEVFVPRFVLPAAKPSLQASLPAPSPQQEHSKKSAGGSDSLSVSPKSTQAFTQEPVAPKSSKNVSGIVTNIMGALGADFKDSAKSNDRKADTSIDQGQPNSKLSDHQESDLPVEASPQKEVVEFSLSLWRVNDNLMVIDTRLSKQALPTTALLSNILFAKGISQRLPAPEVLTWPMFEHMQASGGWSEAADMVNAFLNARFSVQPVQYLWLMGESAFKAVATEDSKGYQECLGAALDMPSLSALGLVLPSLTDMLRTPELKSIAWSAIKPYGIE